MQISVLLFQGSQNGFQKYELRVNGAQRRQSFPSAIERFGGIQISDTASQNAINFLFEDGTEFV